MTSPADPPERAAGPVAGALAGVLTGYRRWISPMLAPRCRFAPTCSEYGITALRHHGAIRGGALAVWRVLRCQPFHPGGYDPVPPKGASTASSSSGAARC